MSVLQEDNTDCFFCKRVGRMKGMIVNKKMIVSIHD